MGIPYSREINNAFEQVTPLVAAGFKVLKTTQNISILLAIIQVLTCVFLAAILMVLIGILYSVNPDLEKERKEMVTPFFQSLANVTFLGMIEGLAATLVGFGGFVVMGFMLLKSRKPDEIELQGIEDADKALEDLDEGNSKKGKKGKKGVSKDSSGSNGSAED